MICLRCDNEEFKEKPEAVVEQEFRGETLKVQSPMMACTRCGWLTADVTQLEELRRRTADAYREKHGLLTSDEIRTLRQRLGLSQQGFASLIKAGVASVKRWESWQVQEASMDMLMRLVANEEHQRLARFQSKFRVRDPSDDRADSAFIVRVQFMTVHGQRLQPTEWHVRLAEEPASRGQQRDESHEDRSLLSAA